MYAISCVNKIDSEGNLEIQSVIFLSFLVLSNYTLCKSCQQELKSCYNFRKRCHEIYSLYEEVHEDENVFANPLEIESINIEIDQSIKTENEPLLQEIEKEEPDYEEYFNPPESDDNDDDESYNPENDEDEAEAFECTQCPKTFKKRNHLVSHQASHENLRLYQCNRSGCNSAFNVAARLIRHLRNVHQAEDEEVAEAKDLTRDLKPQKIHKVKEKVPPGKVQCEICNKILSNTRYLKEHMTLQHLKTTKYVCKELGCKKRFKILSLLEKHMRKHSGLVDFVCKFCGKGYVQRKVFNQHLRKSHQISQEEIDQLRWSVDGCEVRDNKCKDCNEEFKSPHKLFDHRALMHGDGQR